jgi:hypothetical protein
MTGSKPPTITARVRTGLNVSNNIEQIRTQHTDPRWRVALNFVVPRCISSYGAARDEAQRSQGRWS